MAKAKTGKSKAPGPKTERKKAANGKAAKPTAEALSDAQRQTLLFNHKRKIVPLLEAEKNAKGAVTKAYELAKKEGITKKEIKLSIHLETDEGIQDVKNELERTNRIARWMGVGKQLNLFGVLKETEQQRVYEDGRRAALNDQPPKPPSHLGQKDAQTWLEGHSAGRTALNEIRAESFGGPTRLGSTQVAMDLAKKTGVDALDEAPPPTVPEQPEQDARH